MNPLPLPGEEWLPVSGWEGLYEVSNFGRIKRLVTGAGNPRHQILNLGTKRGYKFVTLKRMGRKQFFQAHVLVAAAFLGPRPSTKHEVNHKDFDRANNAVSNLEYLTRSQNLRHASIHRRRTGVGRKEKLTIDQMREVRRLRGKLFQKEIAKRFGVATSTICRVQTQSDWYFTDS